MIHLLIAHGGMDGDEVFLQAGGILMVIAAMIVGVLVGAAMRRQPGVKTTPKRNGAGTPVARARLRPSVYDGVDEPASGMSSTDPRGGDPR